MVESSKRAPDHLQAYQTPGFAETATSSTDQQLNCYSLETQMLNDNKNQFHLKQAEWVFSVDQGNAHEMELWLEHKHNNYNHFRSWAEP